MQTYRVRILTPTSEEQVHFIEDGVLTVGDDGRIGELGTYDGRPVDADLRPAVLSPGFVDAHIHFPQTRVIGQGSGTLLPWLENVVFPEERLFHDGTYAQEVAHEFCEALGAAGTTTSMVYGSVHGNAADILLQTLDNRGMRAIVGPVLMDVDSPPALQVSTAEAMESLEAMALRWHGHDGGRLQVAVIPRFALSCSDEMLAAAGAMAEKHALPISTHLSESVGECAAVLARFGTGDYLEVYERANLVNGRSVFAHCIHLSEDEWDRFRDAGAVVAHCPDSNFFLSSGNMPVDALRDRSIPICIGTDVAAGRTFSIPGILQWAAENAKCVNAQVSHEELFWWGTRGGAQALGFEKLGILEAGWEADMILLDLPETLVDGSALLSRLLEAGSDLSVLRAWVRGRQVWSSGE